MASQVAKVFRPLMRFPNYTFRLLNVDPDQRKVKFDVPKHLTKVEIRNYLQSVYRLDVDDVHTLNRAGERFRVRKMPLKWTKERDIKVAIVTLKEGAQIPALPAVA